MGFSCDLYEIGEINLSDEIEEIIFLRSEVQRLRERVGSWRRLAQEKGPRRECIREGWSTDYDGMHYKVFAVQDLPGDLPITEVITLLRSDFLPALKPYCLRRVDYSSKYKGWLVTVETFLFIPSEM